MPFLGALTLADLLDDLRARGALPGSGQALAETLAAHCSKTRPQSRPVAADGASPSRPVATEVVVRTLARLTYPEAICGSGRSSPTRWPTPTTAAFLHRDIKPANVLLTDEGLPMLSTSTWPPTPRGRGRGSAGRRRTWPRNNCG